MANSNMGTQIKHIETKPHWEIKDEWSSHLPALYLALTKGHGQYTHVTEFGGGLHSTLRLSQYCANQQIPFTCFETSAEWIANIQAHCPYAKIIPVDSYYEILPAFDKPEGFLFVDSAPAETRKSLLERHANHAAIIVVHDTEPRAEYVYHMHSALASFKYRLDFTPDDNPHTTIVSNFINVEKWKST